MSLSLYMPELLLPKVITVMLSQLGPLLALCVFSGSCKQPWQTQPFHFGYRKDMENFKILAGAELMPKENPFSI